MVAGVSGIDLAVLVIAADDGIMPQTIEHLEIMSLMGVRKGIVALTKIDLVDRSWIEQRRSEIRDFLSGTPLDGAPICPLSSETFEGYDSFYEHLTNCAKTLKLTRGHGIFRMPIAQFFSRPGFGTIITGLPVDGSITVGSQVELVPGGMIGRVRGIQRFLRNADEGGCGQCLALNIPEYSRQNLARGLVLSLPGYLHPVHQIHVRLTAVNRLEKPLQNAEMIKFHTGTSEAGGKLYLLEDETLAGGSQGLATVVLDRPIAAVAYDRFVIRRLSPASTVAGGTILDVKEAMRRQPRKELVHTLSTKEDFLGDADSASPQWLARRVECFLLYDRPQGASVREISLGTLLPADVVHRVSRHLFDGGMVLALETDCYIHARTYRALYEAVRDRILRAGESGDTLSLRREELRREFDYSAPLWDRLVQELTHADLVRTRGHKMVLAAAAETIDQVEAPLLQRLRDTYAQTGFHSPRPDELPALLGEPADRINRALEYLINEEELLSVSQNVLLNVHFLRQAQARVVAVIQERGVLNSADFKYEIQSSRKYALAILDWLDARHVTLRIGNDRKLAPDYQKRLL
jgi:selenocysteine-specific elongation factor